MSKNLSKTTHIFSGNFTFIEELYQKYLTDKNSVDTSWREFFEDNADNLADLVKDSKGASWAGRNLKVVGGQDYDISSIAKREPKKDAKAANLNAAGKDLNLRAANLIAAYQEHGHLKANLDPLGIAQPHNVPELDPSFHGIDEEDFSKTVTVEGQKIKISDLNKRLQELYSGNVGCEFEYIRCANERKWLAHEIENTLPKKLEKAEKIKILKEVIRTTKFEQFLHKRFPGAKRFSIEGGESSINSIEKIIEVAANLDAKDIIVGMAHRGRLNTLTGVMAKPYHQMISEFQGNPGIPESVTKSGDVKYHMGYSGSREINGKKVDIALAFNPSHLEAVNPVVTGRVRAKQDMAKENKRNSAMAVLIHGDAAFTGQGIVAETLMMNGIDGYDTGGVFHIIINNQIGFTANPDDSRSTTYSSDFARAIGAPIFHVNGDDVEAVVKATAIVTKYRQEFNKDAVLDIVCYRKYGHNEGDEPLYTQPLMYGQIKSHPTLEEIYSSQLIAEGTVTQDGYQQMVDEFNNHLNDEFELSKTYKVKEPDWLKEGQWKGIKDGETTTPKTAVDTKKLKELGKKITEVPADFNINSKIARQLKAKSDIIDSGKNVDWGTAESLAFASLLDEGHPIRITGQDSGRGTFSHRHSVLHDAKDASRYYPLNNLGDKAANYEVHDSILSEYGVLGFEYGYSLARPLALTIWEAQFGDFANGAQIIFDQFIASSEVKWLRKSGLVMLLPHGYEGQGPEHSSARLERYLQACADNNLRVVNITSPANFFHALRRQIHSTDRKPLVVMTPKSLLRNPMAVSELSEFSKDNKFKAVIAESEKLASDDKIKKVVICSGKVYYDLLKERTDKKINDIAIIRLEQFYPFPDKDLGKELAKYKNAKIVWCQEEPRNMGAWSFVHELIEEVLVNQKAKHNRPVYVGRVACASPATGYASYHAREQKALIDEALS
ncbi:MAG: 2-oxoglutarate dehydrogenase E1 component [Proteobacteria bacterium]|nr:2-oxoglutarate dehydrogenase E1 component [Pseudomonadota bacterium]